MFNNPLSSFHDMVAEAKEEREQLDRLLTISTPRERLVVAVIALVLCILLGWLFFGNVARSLVVDGVLAGQGEHPAGQGEHPAEQGESLAEQDESPAEVSRTVLAFIWAETDIASHIEDGMPVMIETDLADGEKGAHGGTVRAISDVPFSGASGASEPGASEPGAPESVAPVFVHRVHIDLDERLDLNALADRKCRIVIEIGRQTPISLFLTRRP